MNHSGRWAALALMLVVSAAAPALAQTVAIPNLWDPRARQERPDLSGLRAVRFLTEDDFPPLIDRSRPFRQAERLAERCRSGRSGRSRKPLSG